MYGESLFAVRRELRADGLPDVGLRRAGVHRDGGDEAEQGADQGVQGVPGHRRLRRRLPARQVRRQGMGFLIAWGLFNRGVTPGSLWTMHHLFTLKNQYLPHFPSPRRGDPAIE